MTENSASSHHASGPRHGRRAAGAEQPDARVAWHNLLQVSARVIREFDRRLDREHRISAREFDVLINLDNAPDRRLRMTELANAAMLSSGGLTRLSDGSRSADSCGAMKTTSMHAPSTRG